MMRGIREASDDTVFDDDIGDYTTTQLFFRHACAYADASHHTLRAILAADLPKTFAHAQTMHFLFEHAIELFLKGAIFKKDGRIDENHDLKRHYGRYKRLYPKKTFNFTFRIAEVVRANRETSKHSVFPRYPVKRGGKRWEGYNMYTLERWLPETDHLRDDLQRLIKAIEPLPPPAF